MNRHYEPVACFDLSALRHADDEEGAEAHGGRETSLAGRLVLLVTRSGIEVTEVPTILH